MVLELFLLFSVLQFTAVYVYADVIETVTEVNHTCPNVTNCVTRKTINLRKIQYEIFIRMCSTTDGLFNTSITPENENIQFFPILETIRDNMMLIQIFHDNGLAAFYPKDEFLRVPLALPSLLNELKQSSSIITVNFKSAIFFDPYINKGYFHDIRRYYHTDTINMFTRNNTDKSAISINRWMSQHTKGRTIEKENLLVPGLTNYQTIVLEFSACLHVELSEQILLFRSPTLNSEGWIKICVKTFSSMQMLGYHNDNQVGYEAIRVPYKHSNFSMAIILPYENQSLEIFLEFTPKNYLELLNGISEKEEYINYTIPKLNLTMVTINENGTRINPDNLNPISCALPQLHKPLNMSKVLVPKPFVVDKPFGVIIFHHGTKFVLWQAWIRNPNSKLYVPRKFLKHANAHGERFDRRFIF